MKKEHSAGFIIFRHIEAPEFLGVFSRKHQEWGFPKGHLEEGESILDAARRELAEEVLIDDIVIEHDFHETVFYPIVKKGFRIVKRVDFYMARSEREPATSDEIERVEWFRPEEILSGAFFPLQKYLIRKAMSHLNDNERN